jgi:hypothetical protein
MVCNKDKVGDLEIIRIRSNREREDLNKKVEPEELRGRVDQVEFKMVKKFQKWQVSHSERIYVYNAHPLPPRPSRMGKSRPELCREKGCQFR